MPLPVGKAPNRSGFVWMRSLLQSDIMCRTSINRAVQIPRMARNAHDGGGKLARAGPETPASRFQWKMPTLSALLTVFSLTVARTAHKRPRPGA